MIELDPGHTFLLTTLDDNIEATGVSLKYVKRCLPPEKYPGNTNSYAGTTFQEVCRVQIARAQYVLNQALQMSDFQSVEDNQQVIDYQRLSILVFEKRAARRHGRILNLTYEEIKQIELLPTCPKCGHIKPEEHIECKV